MVFEKVAIKMTVNVFVVRRVRRVEGTPVVRVLGMRGVVVGLVAMQIKIVRVYVLVILL